MKNTKKIESVQNWLPFQEILDNGIIKIDENNFIKIINISPINFNLKSELEKEAILNSYKIFLKTCNFNFQILIESNKENLSNHILNIQENLIQENENISEISKKYISYIKNLNLEKKSSSKKYYIILKYTNKNIEINNKEYLAVQELNEKYYKIKDCLSRCGNNVKDLSEKNEVKNIFYSFFNKRLFIKNNN